MGLIHLRFAVAIVTAVGCSTCTQAQTGKQEKVPVFHYVIDDPMDAFGRQPVQAPATKYVSLPDFCRNQPKKGDTTTWFEFYNAAHELLLPDTTQSAYMLRFVSRLEGHIDSLHTYRDAQGKLQPLPVSRIVHRYDRIGNDKWLFVNYKTNKTTTLTELPDNTVAKDTVSSADGSMVVRRYYRTALLK